MVIRSHKGSVHGLITSPPLGLSLVFFIYVCIPDKILIEKLNNINNIGSIKLLAPKSSVTYLKRTYFKLKKDHNWEELNSFSCCGAGL